MIRINLLPVREERRRAVVRQQTIWIAAAAAAAIATCVGMQISISSRISGERTRIAEAKAEIKRLEATLKDVERYRKEQEEMEAKLAVIARLERDRKAPVRIMDELSNRIPERLWLREMRLRDGVLELKGASTDNEVVAAFMTSLSESPMLTRVELQETALKEQDNVKLNEFKILCRDKLAMEAAGAKPAKAKQAGAKPSKRRRR
jgi:type IV pilus assembly protein PilN